MSQIPSAVEVIRQVMADQAKGKAQTWLGQSLLAAAGLGAGARGLLGLWRMHNQPPVAVPSSGGLATELPLPEEPEAAGVKKASVQRFLLGDHATTPQGVPWLMPGLVLGGAASAGAGWKLVDYLLDKRRKAELEQDVNQAKQEFHKALLSSYPQKQAAEGSLSAELDGLYDDFEKTAAMADWGGVAAGGALTVGGALGMLAALVSYQEAKKRSRSATLDKATTHWQRRMWREQPPAVNVIPQRSAPPPILNAATMPNDPEESRAAV